jgi:hypothetical protein
MALSHQPFLLVSTYPLAEAGFNGVNGLAKPVEEGLRAFTC